MQRRKISLLRSPIPNVKLHQLSRVPLLLAEDAKGDICVWNYVTNQVIAVIDARESKQSMCQLTGSFAKLSNAYYSFLKVVDLGCFRQRVLSFFSVCSAHLSFQTGCLGLEAGYRIHSCWDNVGCR